MEELKYTAEFIRKASECQTEDELIELADKEGVEIDKENAASLLEKIKFQFKELSDDELKTIAAGMITFINNSNTGSTTNSQENAQAIENKTAGYKDRYAKC
ncbi:MAG: hypothetical protein PUE71_08430 [Clostridia bacterium]|nr:hypothetical protein [Clostridia bacterium]